MGNPKGVKRDFDQLEQRRLKAAGLFDRDLSQAEVSRRLNVHRQSVFRWYGGWKAQGTKALKKAGRAGRKPRLQPVQLEQLGRGLKEGPEALGYGTGLWTTWRVADLIERQTGQKFHPGHVWRILRSLGWSCQRPVGRAAQRDEPAIQRWKRVRWPEIKKKALQQRRTIVFVDESGLSERPHRVRTWVPRGQTPVLQYSFNWKCLSAMAGITVWNFYFRLFAGSIKAPQVIEFLAHLQRHIGGRLIIIWDGLPVHRSRLVREFVASQRERIQLEFLPAYAPELNPVEYIWGYCKQHELPNLCPKDFAHLSWAARKALGRMRRRPTLVESFWNQAGLF